VANAGIRSRRVHGRDEPRFVTVASIQSSTQEIYTLRIGVHARVRNTRRTERTNPALVIDDLMGMDAFP